MSKTMLTIVVPTKNRVSFMSRLLEYYASVGCEFRILVGDSSDSDQHAQLQSVIARMAGRLDVACMSFPPHHDYAPGQGTIECTKDLMAQVTTPYVVWNPDDDFLIPETLKKCVTFLENNADYSAAQGEALLMRIQRDQIFGKVSVTDPYTLGTNEFTLGSERLLRHLLCYGSNEFAVKRVHHALNNWRDLYEMRMNNLLGELFISCLSLVQGKVKRFDGLYMVRQAHAAMTSVQSHSAIEIISAEDFPRQYRAFVSRVVCELVKGETLSNEEAYNIVQKGCWKFLSHWLTSHWNARYGTSLRRKKFFSSKFLATLRRLLRVGQHPTSLPSLLRPSSPYHREFMSVYQTITESPVRQ